MLYSFYKNGFSVLPYNEDLFLLEGDYYLLGNNGEVLNDDFEVYSSFPLTDETIVDVGGYLGETAVRFVEESECRQVYIYEPSPKHCEIIRDVIDLNGLEDKISLTQKAVS